jgi:hypothetical protein
MQPGPGLGPVRCAQAAARPGNREQPHHIMACVAGGGCDGTVDGWDSNATATVVERVVVLLVCGGCCYACLVLYARKIQRRLDAGIERQEALISSARKAARLFKPGEAVAWTKGDNDLPAGTIGTVVGYKKNGNVSVQFPAGMGMWAFPESEIRKAAQEGVPSSAV